MSLSVQFRGFLPSSGQKSKSCFKKRSDEQHLWALWLESTSEKHPSAYIKNLSLRWHLFCLQCKLLFYLYLNIRKFTFVIFCAKCQLFKYEYSFMHLWVFWVCTYLCIYYIYTHVYISQYKNNSCQSSQHGPVVKMVLSILTILIKR